MTETSKSQKTRSKQDWPRLSTLTIIILAVNMIPLVLMGFGIFYLDKYKQNLLEPAFNNLSKEADLLSFLLQKDINALNDLEQHARDTVLFVVNEDGSLFKQLGDEELLWESLENYTTLKNDQIQGFSETLASFLVWLNPLQTRLPYFPGFSSENYNQSFPEVIEARETERIAFAAWSTQHSFILSTTAPFSVTRNGQEETKVLLLLSDGAPIAAAINEVRIDIMQAFISVLIITFLLSVYLSSFIAIPLKRLGRAAEEIRRGKREITDIPDLSSRKDEIGELSIILRQMTKALHNRMDSIERFAADVSHEIKNPLSSLRSAVESAQIVKDKKDQTRLMEIIKHDVLRLDQLITDISRTSRLDSELARDMFQKVDLKALMIELVNLWRSPMERANDPKNNIEDLDLIETHFTEEQCIILGKSDSLAQAFQNVISNALSFNAEGEKVVIEIHKEPEEKLIQITIEDCGPGMSEAVLERIFERFYTDRPDKKKTDLNSGLGLSIAKQIIEAHDGLIRAENVYDAKRNIKGARFVISLYAAS